MVTWARTITTNTYTATLDDSFLFVNSTANCTITIPSVVPDNSKGYVIKEIFNNANVVVTVKTDSNTCFIDGSNTLNMNTLHEAVELIMGLDGNYWTAGGRISPNAISSIVSNAVSSTTTVSILAGSRWIFNKYQNTTGKTIYVSASISRNAAGYNMIGSVSSVSGGVPMNSTPNSNSVVVCGFTVGGAPFNIGFFVPDKWYYSIISDDGNGDNFTLNCWTEYTLPV